MTYNNSDLEEKKRNSDPFIEEEKGSSIGERLVQLKRGRTNRQVAEEWGVPLSTLTGYFNRGSTPPVDTALSIAIKEGISIEWLVTGTDAPKSNNDASQIVHIEKFAVLASAGGGSYIEDERVEDVYTFTLDFLKRHRLSHAINDLCIIEAKGDSMEPMIFDGYDLLVNRYNASNDMPLAGTYVISVDDSLKVKNLKFDIDKDGYSIISENKAYADEFIPRKELNRMKVIGEVALILGKPIK